MMMRNTIRWRTASLGLFGIVMAANAPALTIVRDFVASGSDFGFGLGDATGAPTTAGGGNLVDIFNAAADCWEEAIMDDHTVTIKFGWQGLGGGTLGAHVLTGEGGTPHRETSAVIRFDSDGTSSFFADSTPTLHEEYTDYTETSADLGGGVVNTGRYFADSIGDAVGRYDLLSTALHEIGHALGLSGANDAFVAENGDGDIDVTGPRPFAGSVIDTISGAHLDYGFTLMNPFGSIGERTRISAIDVLANAQISDFTDLNLNPCPVPEPATLAALGIGAIALRRRKK